MNPELEALLLALDRYLQARGSQSAQFLSDYESQISEVLQRRPTLSRDSLEKAVESAYRRWLKTQKRPSSIPPKA